MDRLKRRSRARRTRQAELSPSRRHPSRPLAHAPEALEPRTLLASTSTTIDLESMRLETIALESRRPAEIDRVRVPLQAGDIVSIDVDTPAGSTLDLRMAVRGPGGGLLPINEQARGQGLQRRIIDDAIDPQTLQHGRDPALSLTAERDGVYTILVASKPGRARGVGEYELNLLKMGLRGDDPLPMTREVAEGLTYAWMSGDDLYLADEAGSGFALQGDWTRTVTPAGNGLSTTSYTTTGPVMIDLPIEPDAASMAVADFGAEAQALATPGAIGGMNAGLAPGDPAARGEFIGGAAHEGDRWPVNAAVAVDPEGDYVVAWQGTEGEGGGIFARQFDRAGEPLGEPFAVNQSPPGNQRDPAIAVDGMGNAVIAWTAGGQDGDGDGVFARRFNALGEPLGDEFLVNQTTPGRQARPTVAMTADGRFLVAWEGNGTGDADGIFARSFAISGLPEGDEFLVNAQTEGLQTRPDADIDDEGNAVVAWVSSGFGINSSVLHRRIPAAGLDGAPAEVGVDRADQPGLTYEVFALNAPTAVASIGAGGDLAASGTTDGFDLGVRPGNLNDNFGVRFRGGLQVEQAGTYTFSTRSDDGSRLYINGQLVVDNDGLHGVQTRSGTIDLTPGVHEIEVQFIEAGGAEILAVTYSGPGLAEQAIPPEALVPLRGDLTYEVVRGSFSSVSQLHTGQVMGGGRADNFDIAVRPPGLEDQFGMRFRGGLQIEQAGTYTFFTNSTDGSRLFINGQLVVDNDGGHPPQVRTGTIDLEPGIHELEVTYFEGTGLQILEVGYGGPGVPEQLIPDDVLVPMPEVLGFDVFLGRASSVTELAALSASAEERPFLPVVTSGVAGSFSLATRPLGLNDDFGVRFRGGLEIEEAGTYTFATVSDDGSRVYINGHLVVDNDGFHAAQRREGTIDLVPGVHDIEVLFFEGPGAERLDVLYSGPGIPEQPIPRDRLVATDQVMASPSIPGNQSGPAVALGPDGEVIIAWEEADGSGPGIFQQRFDAAGNTASDRMRVNFTKPGEQADPEVATDPEGNAVITWTSAGQDGDAEGIYAQLYDANGSRVGPETLVNNALTAGRQRRPDVGFSDDGDIVLVWDGTPENPTAPDDTEIGIRQLFFDRNTELYASQGMDAARGTSDVATDAEGNFVVVWKASNEELGLSEIRAQGYRSDGRSVGSEFVVASPAGGARNPAVDMNADGTFLVVWQADDGDGQDGIFARRYSADGQPAGPEFLVNMFTDGLRIRPDVALDAAGNAVVVFENSGNVFIQRFDPANNRLGGGVRANAREADFQGSPSVDMNGSGTFVVGWSGVGDTDASGSYFRAFGFDGTPLGGDVHASGFEAPGSARIQERTSVAITEMGSVLAAWQSRESRSADSPNDVFVRRFRVDGAATSEIIPVNVIDREGDQHSPDVSAALDGSFIVAYQGSDSSGAGAFAQLFLPSGAREGDAFRLNATEGGGQFAPSVVMDGLGNFAAAWTSGPDAAASDVVVRRGLVDLILLDQGERLGEIAVNTSTLDNQRNADVATDIAGNFVVVWESPDASGTGVYARLFAASGRPLTGEFLVNVDQAGNQADPAVDMTTDGSFVVAFETIDSTNAIGINYRRFDPMGMPIGGEVTANAFTTGDQSNPDVAIDAAGNVVVTWETLASGRDQINFRRFPAVGDPDPSNVLVFRAPDSGPVDNPSIAMTNDGRFVIAYDYRSEVTDATTNVFFRAYNPDGSPRNAHTRLNQDVSGLHQANPSVAIDRQNGDFVITWTRFNDLQSYSIHAEIFNRDLTPRNPFGDEFLVHAQPAGASSIVPDPSASMSYTGSFAVTWSETEPGGNFEIFTRQYSSMGPAIAPAYRVNNFTTFDQQVPAAALTPEGQLIVAWQSAAQDGDGTGIVARRDVVPPGMIMIDTGGFLTVGGELSAFEEFGDVGFISMGDGGMLSMQETMLDSIVRMVEQDYGLQLRLAPPNLVETPDGSYEVQFPGAFGGMALGSELEGLGAPLNDSSTYVYFTYSSDFAARFGRITASTGPGVSLTVIIDADDPFVYVSVAAPGLPFGVAYGFSAQGMIPFTPTAEFEELSGAPDLDIGGHLYAAVSGFQPDPRIPLTFDGEIVLELPLPTPLGGDTARIFNLGFTSVPQLDDYEMGFNGTANLGFEFGGLVSISVPIADVSAETQVGPGGSTFALTGGTPNPLAGTPVEDLYSVSGVSRYFAQVTASGATLSDLGRSFQLTAIQQQGADLVLPGGISLGGPGIETRFTIGRQGVGLFSQISEFFGSVGVEGFFDFVDPGLYLIGTLSGPEISLGPVLELGGDLSLEIGINGTRPPGSQLEHLGRKFSGIGLDAALLMRFDLTADLGSFTVQIPGVPGVDNPIPELPDFEGIDPFTFTVNLGIVGAGFAGRLNARLDAGLTSAGAGFSGRYDIDAGAFAELPDSVRAIGLRTRYDVDYIDGDEFDAQIGEVRIPLPQITLPTNIPAIDYETFIEQTIGIDIPDFVTDFITLPTIPAIDLPAIPIPDELVIDLIG